MAWWVWVMSAYMIVITAAFITVMSVAKWSTKKTPSRPTSRTIVAASEQTDATFDTCFSRMSLCPDVPLDSILKSKDLRVCIVGNGPSVLTLTNGSVIDSHDVVIRLNDFKTEGFETHTGQKITHWVTGLGRQQDMRDFSANPNLTILVWSHVFTNERAVLKRVRNMVKFSSDVHVYFTNTHSIMNNLATQYNLGCEPTTGFSTLMLAAHYYTQPISIIGFDCTMVNNNANMEHYFGKVTTNSVVHNVQREREVINDMRKQGRFKVLS